MKHYSTLTSIAVAVVRAARSYGVEVEALLVQAGLDTEAIKNPNARYPDTGLNRLIELATAASGDERFGVTVGRYIAPTSLHALGFSLLASETLLAALQRLVKTYSLEKVQYYMGQLKALAADSLQEALRPWIGKGFEAEERMDDGRPIRVKVTVEETGMAIDFTGTGTPHPHNLNANISIVYSAVI